MSDELSLVPEQVERLPSPRDVGTMLIAALASRVERLRQARGAITQPEDVNRLVRALGATKEMLEDYARAFTTAVGMTNEYLTEELITAVGEQDGIPTSGLKVPDLDGTDLVFSLMNGNTHTIDTAQVIDALITDVIDTTRGTEPAQYDTESDVAYLARYEAWIHAVIRAAVTRVLETGSYSMQVSKVRAAAIELAAHGQDNLAAVVRGSVKSKSQHRGVKFERKERRK